MKSTLKYLLAGVFLAACTNSVQDTGSAIYSVNVKRGMENQVSLAVQPNGSTVLSAESSLRADLSLIEEEGFHAAKDRFTQMDALRRLGRGRLSELFGASAEAKDRKTIGVGLPWAVDNSAARIRKEFPEVALVLEAYAKGVNRFVDNIATLDPQLLVQYRAITYNGTYTPTQWEPEDSIAIATGLSFLLSSALEEKMNLTMLSQILLANERFEDFINFLDLRPIKETYIVGKKPRNTPPPAGARFRFTGKKTKLPDFTYKCRNEGFPFPDCGKRPGMGSNNWVVSKAFSGTNESFIANDPHLPLTFPMTMYEVALDSKSAGGSIRVRGVKPAGVPGVLIGHNDDIAWGLTNLGADVDDIYLESMDDKYMVATVNGVATPVNVVSYSLKVRNISGGLDTRNVKLKIVPGHGPIFSDHIPEVNLMMRQLESGEAPFGKHLAVSYRWTGHGTPDKADPKVVKGTTEIVAVWELNRAKSLSEFKAALNYFEAGAQNIVFSDRDGNINYVSHGNFPVRKYLNEFIPPYMFVTPPPPGDSREWEPEYRKEVPQKSQSDGFIVSANNDPWGHSSDPMLSNYDDYFGYGFTDGIRAFRITELLEKTKATRGKLTVEDMQAIQLDVKDVLAESILDLVAAAKPETKLSEAGKAYYQKLLDWKATGPYSTMESTATYPMYEWLELLARDYFADVKGNINGLYGQGYDHVVDQMLITSMFIKTVYFKVKAGLDKGSGPEYDKMQTLIVNSLEKANTKVAASGKEGVAWGKMNRLEFANMLPGIVPALFTYPLLRPGTWETVDPAAPGIGACFRVVMTLKPNEPIQARIAVTGGNYTSRDPKGASRELRNWRDGIMRDLVSFTK